MGGVDYLRPDAWRYWCSRSRKATVSPPIPPGFGSDCINFWKAVQPPCRISAAGLLVQVCPDETSAWVTINNGGPNGIIAFLFLLLWWHNDIDERGLGGDVESDDATLWKAMAEDLIWCLEVLHSVNSQS
jgi:hypothetical protein